jgi:hypothetical protein
MAKGLSVGASAKRDAFVKWGGFALGDITPADGGTDYTTLPDNTEPQLAARKLAKTRHDAWVFGMPDVPEELVYIWRSERVALVGATGSVTLRNAALFLGVQDAQVRSWAMVNGFGVKDGMIAARDVHEMARRRDAMMEYVVHYDKENTVDDTGDRAAKANAAKYDAVMAGFALAGFTPSAEVIAALKAQYGVS